MGLWVGCTATRPRSGWDMVGCSVPRGWWRLVGTTMSVSIGLPRGLLLALGDSVFITLR
jgi:hypothetical protein